MPRFHVYETPDEIEEFRSDVVYVVVDVIISSTTIIHLLSNGVEYVKPFFHKDDAFEFKESTDSSVLVGEQGGGPIEGFDLSPLPVVLSNSDIHEKRVGILTTNGTVAMQRIGLDKDIYVGSTVNAEAIAEQLRNQPRDVYVVGAGRFNKPTDEDTVGAELIRDYGEQDPPDQERIERYLERIDNASTTEWLRDLGFDVEINRIKNFNTYDTVPALHGEKYLDRNGD